MPDDIVAPFGVFDDLWLGARALDWMEALAAVDLAACAVITLASLALMQMVVTSDRDRYPPGGETAIRMMLGLTSVWAFAGVAGHVTGEVSVVSVSEAGLHLSVAGLLSAAVGVRVWACWTGRIRDRCGEG